MGVAHCGPPGASRPGWEGQVRSVTECSNLSSIRGLMATARDGAVESVKLAAAGSLRQPMTAIAAAFKESAGVSVSAEYGASGLLREKIAARGGAHVFASANVEHPAALAKDGKAAPPVVFAHNGLCALARPEVRVTSDTLLAVLLDPAIRLGTSTPKSDPCGDYAWELFRKAEALRPGARSALEAKALQLTGGPHSAPPPPDRSVYGALLTERKADLMLVYRTSARQAAREVPGLQVVDLPETLSVLSSAGLTVLHGSPPAAYRFALFVLSQDGQGILAQFGFTAPLAQVSP